MNINKQDIEFINYLQMYGRSKNAITTIGLASTLSELAVINDSYRGCLTFSEILFKVKSNYLIEFNEYIDVLNSLVLVNYKEIADYALKIIATRISIAYPPTESQKEYCTLFDVDRYISQAVLDLYKEKFTDADYIKCGFANIIKNIKQGKDQ